MDHDLAVLHSDTGWNADGEQNWEKVVNRDLGS